MLTTREKGEFPLGQDAGKGNSLDDIQSIRDSEGLCGLLLMRRVAASCREEKTIRRRMLWAPSCRSL